MFRIVPDLMNLLVSRSSSILRPSISGLLSPIQEPSDSEFSMGDIGKMNGVSIFRGGGTPRKIGWGCAAHFSKPLTYLGPHSAIFPTLFMTWPLNQAKIDTLFMTKTAEKSYL